MSDSESDSDSDHPPPPPPQERPADSDNEADEIRAAPTDDAEESDSEKEKARLRGNKSGKRKKKKYEPKIVIDERTGEAVLHDVAIDADRLCMREKLLYWLRWRHVLGFPVYLPAFFFLYVKNVEKRVYSSECIITERSLVHRNGGFYRGVFPMVGEFVPAGEKIVMLSEISDVTLVAPGRTVLDQKFGVWTAFIRTSSSASGDGATVQIQGLAEPLLFEKELLDAMRRAPGARTGLEGSQRGSLQRIEALLDRLVLAVEK